MPYLNDKVRIEIAELFYKSGAFKANTGNPFHVGKNRSPIYIRSQEFLSDVNLRNELIEHLEKTANELYFDIIAGIETGSMPFSSKLADRLNRPEIYTRQKKTKYGPQIEGISKDKLKDKKILLIEDTIYKGTTLKESILLLENSGAKVEDCILFFDREQYDKELFQDINIHDLTNISIMLGYLVDQGIGPANHIQTEEIKKYLNNPEQWHKSRGFSYHKQ